MTVLPKRALKALNPANSSPFYIDMVSISSLAFGAVVFEAVVFGAVVFGVVSVSEDIFESQS